VVEKIGSTPIGILILIALLLIAARSASLVLEATKPETKRRPSRKEVLMSRELIAASTLETAWAIGVSVAAGSLPPSP
jgi:hypothetical protein